MTSPTPRAAMQMALTLTEEEREHIHQAIDMLGNYEAEQRERGNNTEEMGASATRHVLEKLFRFLPERASLSCLAAGEEPPGRTLPHPGSPEASAMMDSLLAEYQWPANTKNAARAGWEAAERWLRASALRGAAGETPAHSKSEYKRRVAMGDPSVTPPAGTRGAAGEDEDEWEHPCPFRGEPTKTPAGEACSACGLRESHINDAAASTPRGAAGEGGEQTPYCVECGDGIMVHDPGICGCCYAIKYHGLRGDEAQPTKEPK